MGGCLPALTAFVVDRTENQYRGIAFSIFFGAFDVGMLLGGAALGLLADITSWGWCIAGDESYSVALAA